VARNTSAWERALLQRNEACNLYNQTLHSSKNSHWKNWLENINEQEIWRASKFAKNPMSDGGCCQISTLHKKSSDNEMLHTYTTDVEKADTFASLFFLLKPLSLPDTPGDVAPDPPPLPFHLPHLHQIVHKIKKTSAHKAPGNDGIPNIVLKRCVPLIAPILLTCLQAILRLQYFPHQWREWTTVVI
jgi:hypothetical protein